MKPTKIFVHWYWQCGEKEHKLFCSRKNAAKHIRKLRDSGVRVIWTIYPQNNTKP